MIRKQTWILLAVFAVLAGAAYYLTKNPLPTSNASATPSPTEPAKALPDWQPSDITAITVKEGSSSPFTIAKDSSGSWLMDAKDKLDAAKVEQIVTSLSGLRVQATVDSGNTLDVLGLNAPAETLSITNKQNQTVDLRIGKLTPTESGYYAQSGSAAPVVLSKGGVDELLQLVSKASLLNWTPTPSPGAPGVGTPQPATTATAQP